MTRGLAATAVAEQGYLCTGHESDYLLIVLSLSFLLSNSSPFPVGPLLTTTPEPCSEGPASKWAVRYPAPSELSDFLLQMWGDFIRLRREMRQEGRKRQSYLDRFCSLNISSSCFLQYHRSVFSTFIKDKLTKTQSTNSQTV